ncbi:MAG: twin-arginine translocation signal domain-containing protein [Sedimentisphaerales bacterium]|nr:twin-arginine translocation signal domain-containing protein [Sedimentisphaerales bacterium]
MQPHRPESDRTGLNRAGLNRARLNRREFIRRSSVAGLVMGSALWPAGAAAGTKGDTIDEVLHVAILGAGTQGRQLMEDCLRIGQVRIRAVCDIWESYRLLQALRNIGRRGDYGDQSVPGYVDYREMLEKQTDLDAVIIATPDGCHAAVPSSWTAAGTSRCGNSGSTGGISFRLCRGGLTSRSPNRSPSRWGLIRCRRTF